MPLQQGLVQAAGNLLCKLCLTGTRLALDEYGAAQCDRRVDGGRLYLRGQREKPVVPAGDAEVSVTLMEIDSGRFQRKLPLPDDAQLDGMTALYKNGFLWITIPRTGESG